MSMPYPLTSTGCQAAATAIPIEHWLSQRALLECSGIPELAHEGRALQPRELGPPGSLAHRRKEMYSSEPGAEPLQRLAHNMFKVALSERWVHANGGSLWNGIDSCGVSTDRTKCLF